MDEAGIFASFIAHNKCLSKKRVAIYGTGKYAHRFANEQDAISVVCYLDKEKKGEFCNKPIMSLEHAFRDGVDAVIIAASAYNEIIIYDRIKDICRKNNVEIYGVHYGELTKYVGDKFIGYAASNAVANRTYDKIIINWDNTILFSEFFSKYHFFRFLEMKALSEGICVSNLALARDRAETILTSKRVRFDLDGVYQEMQTITRVPVDVIDRIKEIEKELLSKVWKPSITFISTLGKIQSSTKTIIVDNKTCYSDKTVLHLLETLSNGLLRTVEFLDEEGEPWYNQCDGTSQEERRKLYISYKANNDEYRWRVNNTDVWVLENEKQSILDDNVDSIFRKSCHLNTHSLLSLAYKNVAMKNGAQTDLSVDDIYNFTYLYLAPLISAYVIWLLKKFEEQRYDAVLFAARDGFLIKELYDCSRNSLESRNLPRSIYFYTSRMASIKAGMFDDDDVYDVCKYLNKDRKELPEFLYQNDLMERMEDKNRNLKELSKCERKNYDVYFANNGIDCKNGCYAFCDLISGGTSQFFLQKHFSHQLQGYYLAYYISKLGAVPVKSLYPCTSAEQIFPEGIRNILESILTSFEPSVIGFDDSGNPMFSKNVPSDTKLKYIAMGQKAILDFYNEYWKNLYCSDSEDLEYMMPVVWIELLRKNVMVNDHIFDNVCLTEDMFKKEISLSFVEA